MNSPISAAQASHCTVVHAGNRSPHTFRGQKPTASQIQHSLHKLFPRQRPTARAHRGAYIHAQLSKRSPQLAHRFAVALRGSTPRAALENLQTKGMITRHEVVTLHREARSYAHSLVASTSPKTRSPAARPLISQITEKSHTADRSTSASVTTHAPMHAAQPIHRPQARPTSFKPNPNPGPAAGAAPFLWKPSSDSDGKLVVLLPSELTGLVAKLDIFSPQGGLLTSGRYAGVGNGDREHFRFTQAGSKFPSGSLVRASLKDGTAVTFQVPNTGARFEQR
jgi:hypothetical protein